MQNKHYLVIGIALVAAIVVGAWILLTPKQATAPSTTGSSTATTSLDGVTVVGSGATVTEITAPKPPATPALAFSADLPEDAKVALQHQWATLTGQIKASATPKLDLWFELGTVYKIAGQYDAAIAAWSYVTAAASPGTAYPAWGNLGDLYLNFIHDYAKAAAAYKLALKGDPNNPDYQQGLKSAQSHL